MASNIERTCRVFSSPWGRGVLVTSLVVVAVHHLSDARGLGGVFDFNGDVEGHLRAIGDVVHRDEGGAGAYLGPHGNRRRESDFIRTVVDAHGDTVDFDDAGSRGVRG